MRCNIRVDEFVLPGYDVEQLLGFGSCGEVWRAREQTTGDSVALKRLRRGAYPPNALASGIPEQGIPERGIPEPFSKQRLHREAALLATVRHEHIVRLRGVVQAPDGLVLVLDYADGGSLASLLAVRGRLSAGEVVTIGVPLARALADVHAKGLTHGDVTPANVLFDASGKPLLADLGVAAVVGESGAVTAGTPGFADPALLEDSTARSASDVHGLAAVCYAALAGVAPYAHGTRPAPLGDLVADAPPALIAAIDGALDRDPRNRPDAASFARALYSTCTPRAVGLVAGRAPVPVDTPTTHVSASRTASPPSASADAHDGGDDVVEGGRHRPRRVSSPLLRPVVAGMCAIGLLVAAVFVGVGWASHDRSASASVGAASAGAASSSAARVVSGSASAVPSPAAPSSPLPAGDARWAHVLGALDAARDRAFVDADAGELDGVYIATSPALAADQRTMRDLVAAGEHARNLVLRLTSVAVLSQTQASVVLRVRDVLPSYDLVHADGRVERQAGRGERDWIVTLRAGDATDAWRIDTIAPG